MRQTLKPENMRHALYEGCETEIRPEFEQIIKKLIEKRMKELLDELDKLDNLHINKCKRCEEINESCTYYSKSMYENAKKAIEIGQAILDDKDIEIKNKYGDWVHFQSGIINIPSMEYRVKKAKPTYDQINYDEKS